jgi:hypothetical protein
MEKRRLLFRLIHFNDSYNMTESPEEVCGGMARFVPKMLSFPEPKLHLFSGDLWSPSRRSLVLKTDSTIFRGEQLIMPINECKIDVACLGNHDLVNRNSSRTLVSRGQSNSTLKQTSLGYFRISIALMGVHWLEPKISM